MPLLRERSFILLLFRAQYCLALLIGTRSLWSFFSQKGSSHSLAWHHVSSIIFAVRISKWPSFLLLALLLHDGKQKKFNWVCCIRDMNLVGPEWKVIFARISPSLFYRIALSAAEWRMSVSVVFMSLRAMRTKEVLEFDTLWRLDAALRLFFTFFSPESKKC